MTLICPCLIISRQNYINYTGFSLIFNMPMGMCLVSALHVIDEHIFIITPSHTQMNIKIIVTFHNSFLTALHSHLERMEHDYHPRQQLQHCQHPPQSRQELGSR